MRLGTATRGGEGARRFLAAPLPSDPDRIVDLTAVEAERLRKLGEGDPPRLAQALVPSSLREILEGGPRAWHRAEQTLAYAEKWAQRGPLTETLAPGLHQVRLMPCLPRPLSLRLPDGSFGDRFAIGGPDCRLPWTPGLELRPTLAVAGQAGGLPGGFLLAVMAGGATLLGPWLHRSIDLRGTLFFDGPRSSRQTPLDPWSDLILPRLRPGEVLLLPPPIWEAPEFLPGDRIHLRAPFGGLSFTLARAGTHPTLQ
ncbi:MAG: hypothetical protein HY823_14270 [Acidobacteria bacterium]|nr:hypothetical protein [Acidobacteriota bacterium]